MTLKQASENINCNTRFLDNMEKEVSYRQDCLNECKCNPLVKTSLSAYSKESKYCEFMDSPNLPIKSLISPKNYSAIESPTQLIDGLNLLVDENVSTYEETTFNLTFWDKTICSFGPKDSKKIHLLLNFTEHLSVIFGWIFLTLINLWLLNGVDYRSEWILLAILSVIPFYRNTSSISDFFMLTLFHLILDAAVGTAIFHLYPNIDTSWLCVFIDLFTYLNTVGSLRGVSIQTTLYALVFTYFNHILEIQLIPSGIFFFISVHAIGHAAFLGLGEVVVQAILLRNQNFSNPIFGYDKAEIVHKFQYLKLSGKLEKVSSPHSDPKQDSNNIKVKSKKQNNNRKNTSPRPKVPSDIVEEQTVLRPCFGDIVDSFELCSLDSTPTTLTLSWFVPINFLYFLSKSESIINDQGSQEKNCANRSQALEEIECPLSNFEVMNTIEVTFRINGVVWPHWVLNKDASSVSVIGLVPGTPYKITMTVMGFRSSALQLITKPIVSEPNMTPKSHLDYAKIIRQHTILDQKLSDARKLKKEELALLKKFRRNIAQLEQSNSQELQKIEELLKETTIKETVMQKSKISFIAEIQNIKKEMAEKERALATIHVLIKGIEDQLSSVRLEHKGLAEFNESLSKQLNEKDAQNKVNIDELVALIKGIKQDKQNMVDIKASSEIETKKAIESIKATEAVIEECQDEIKNLKVENGYLYYFIKFITNKELEEINPEEYYELINDSDLDANNGIIKSNKLKKNVIHYNELNEIVQTRINSLLSSNQTLKSLVESEDKFVERLQMKQIKMEAQQVRVV